MLKARKPASMRWYTTLITRMLRSVLIALAWTRIAPVRVYGREEHLYPLKGGYLVASNHRWQLGTVFMWGALRENTATLAKAELWKWPVVGQFMWFTGNIPVKRGNRESGLRAQQRCVDVLKRGGIVPIYPEGGITKGDTMTVLKHGVYYIALAAGVPIVPMGDRWVPRSERPRVWWKIIRRGQIVLEFGEPIDPANYTGDDAKDRCMADLAVSLSELSGFKLPLTQA